jgi:hypothetical protein
VAVHPNVVGRIGENEICAIRAAKLLIGFRIAGIATNEPVRA